MSEKLEKLREKVARVLCWKEGMNPDLTLGGDGVNFLWHEYESRADAAIVATIQGLIEMKLAAPVPEYRYEDAFKAILDELESGPK